MAILANRIRTKNYLSELNKFILFLIKKFFILILLILCCGIVYFTVPKKVNNIVLESVGTTLSASNKIYLYVVDFTEAAFSRLLYLKNLEAENVKLKLEIELLKKIEKSESVLKAENIALREILNVSSEFDNFFVTAKIIGTSISPFSSSAIIKAGENDGVKVNNIVTGKHGLIGRVTEVSKNYSSVMLINDHNSRIPVFAGNRRVRGILAKQGDELKIIYLEKNHNLKIGEIVYTSGDGKIFSSDIPVGTITRIAGNDIFVQPIENFNSFNFVIVRQAF